MEKDRVLVFGCHTDYLNNRDYIEKNFNIAAYYDSDESRLPDSELSIHSASELKKRIGDFDCILVTADPVSIVTDLIEVWQVDTSKIKVLFYEMSKVTREYMDFHGTYTEDAVLCLVFNSLEIPIEKVRYLEIGTNDPIRDNNTYFFYKRGARGVLVDPISVVGELVKMVRPEDFFINVAISDKQSDGKVTFYRSKSSTISSLVSGHHKKWDGRSHNETVEITVPLMGINELFKQVSYVPELFCVDAEGYDEIIIRGLDFNLYSPKVILVEIGHLYGDICSFDEYMESQGYFLYSVISANAVYVLRELFIDFRG